MGLVFRLLHSSRKEAMQYNRQISKIKKEDITDNGL